MRLVVLSGGVGGARLGRGLARLTEVETTMVVNVGDDEITYGLHVSPDLDTVLYTLAGIEGPEGWGRADDTWEVMGHLAALGVDTAFTIGDSDLATNLFRTLRLRQRETLSAIAAELAARFGVTTTVLPASDQPIRTRVATSDGEWLTFQDYFVHRNQRDEVSDLRFDGAASALPAPGVLEALAGADAVIVAPSNPPLSIWPILAIPGIEPAVATVGRVIGISPLFGGEALKGPAHRVLAGLGYPRGNSGVIAAYDGLLTDLVIDRSDADEAITLRRAGLSIHVADTRIGDAERAERLARWLVELVT
jgi:LPPG:FO 2-phospho-L-lactate transferase